MPKVTTVTARIEAPGARASLAWAAGLAAALAPTAAGWAAESVWTGNGSAADSAAQWTSPGNWGGAVPPAGNDIRFGTGFASGLLINALGSRSVGTLTVDTTAAFG